MKKYLLMLALMGSLTILPTMQSQAIAWVVVKAALIKVIKAIDLGIQRQQNKIIWLQNAQKALENTMSKLKLDQIGEWSEKQRDLYDKYFKELWKVKNAISAYREVKSIIQRQALLVREYENCWGLFQKDGHFTGQELAQMYRVYSGILEESLRNIEELILVTSSMSTQMSDGKRLELITTAGNNLEQNLVDLRNFNNQNIRISLSRARTSQELEMLKKVYGKQN